MEVGIWNRHLNEIVTTAYDLTRHPRDTDFAFIRFCVLSFFHALGKFDRLLDARAQLVECPLRVRMPRWGLTGEPGCTGLDIVTGALNLIDEWLLIWRQPPLQQ